MQQEYTKVLELPEYAPVMEQLSRLVGGVHSARMARMEHGDVEQWLEEEGTEFLRRLMQAHLDERAKAEPRLDCVLGADGVARNHVRQDSQRGLMTVFGDVQVRRLSYGQRGEASLFPLDAKLNLPPDKYSHGMRRRVAEEVARNSFDSAVTAIERTTGGKVPKYQSEQLAAEIAEGFERFYAERSAKSPEATMDPLIISMDGKGIVMRNDSLREATRQAAEREKHKLKTRLCRGEKRNRKRMATVAAVYSIERNARSAEAIMGLEERPENPRGRNKRVWASVEREPEAITEEMFQEALHRDPWRRRSWVDGNAQQIKLIKDAAKQHRVNIMLVLDFGCGIFRTTAVFTRPG